MKWNVGDWGFFERKLVQVTEVTDGEVLCVRDGYFCIGGNLNGEIFPLSLKGKVISEEIQAEYKRIYNAQGSMNLNIPDINRWFNSVWVTCMENLDDDKYIEQQKEAINKFVAEALDQIAQIKKTSVLGVKLFS